MIGEEQVDAEWNLVEWERLDLGIPVRLRVLCVGSGLRAPGKGLHISLLPLHVPISICTAVRRLNHIHTSAPQSAG